MSKISKALAGLAGLALAGVGAAPASAVVGTCSYLGHSTQQAGAVAWVLGTGNFAFESSLGACAGWANGVPQAVVLGDPTFSANYLQASGTFSSVVCGTGVAVGSAVLRAAGLSGTSTFTIPFLAGQGVAVGTYTSADAGPLAGFVEIIPNNAQLTGIFGGQPNHPVLPPPTSNTCVDNYAVAGAIAFSD